MDRITTPKYVGGDAAEDVFGGLDAMLKLSWPTTGTKVPCIILLDIQVLEEVWHSIVHESSEGFSSVLSRNGTYTISISYTTTWCISECN